MTSSVTPTHKRPQHMRLMHIHAVSPAFITLSTRTYTRACAHTHTHPPTHTHTHQLTHLRTHMFLGCPGRGPTHWYMFGGPRAFRNHEKLEVSQNRPYRLYWGNYSTYF